MGDEVLTGVSHRHFEIAAEAARQRLKSQEFSDFFDGHSPVNEFAVAVLSPEDQALLKAATPTIHLSRISLEEHKAKHPEIGLEDYRRIQEIIESGDMYQQNNYRYILLKQGETLYRAAFKMTRDGEKLYFLTLFKTTEELAEIQVRKKFKKLR